MCILCVIQKWSRRCATMLPWLVLPVIGLWALSQLLPPPFRFEISSPGLACVFVLLVTLFWYEVLMPRLSTWRERRDALLRERKMLGSIELQKLKKTATKCCRNCSTPYRNQNPGGGRFWCSHCGHTSKRPILDMNASPRLGVSGSGGDKILNRTGCQEWLENSMWAGGSTYWRNNSGSTTYGDGEKCLGEKSHPGGVVFTCRLLTIFSSGIRWLWRKVFSFSSSVDESSTDTNQKRLLAKQGENGISVHETRAEKKRKKAEKKRIARLKKDKSDEEARKDKEDIARLVQEQRRLKDEEDEATKCDNKSLLASKEKVTKKEAKKKRHERKKERDKASSKSNADAEELDKSIGKETDHKRHVSDKFSSPNNANMTGGDSRYLDRVKDSLFSPSKAFTDSRFFGRGANMSSTNTKENKPMGSHPSPHYRHNNPPDVFARKSCSDGGERNINSSVVSEAQPSGEPKKSWHQLFTSSTTSVPASSNVISRPSTNPKAVDSSQVPNQAQSIRTLDNPISFGYPSPFTIPNSSSLGFSSESDSVLPPQIGENPPAFIPDVDHFQDPCYVPSSEPDFLKNSPFCDVTKPCPIESPLSKLRVPNETQVNDGSWQMWKTNFGDNLHSNTTASLFAKDDSFSSAYSQRKDSSETDRAFCSVAGPSHHDPWSQKMFLPENIVSLSRPKETVPKSSTYMSPTGVAPKNPSEVHSPPNH